MIRNTTECRFGESALHQCEVMLKDISDSKRINSLLHSLEDDDADNGTGSKELRNLPYPVNAVIISVQFWPQLREENLQLPEEVAKSLEVYTKAFEAMKGNRTLVSDKSGMVIEHIVLVMGRHAGQDHFCPNQ